MCETKEHPILFKAEMIRAILSGQKTQTRRAVTQNNSMIDGTGEGIRAHWPHLEWDKAWVDPGPSPAGNMGPYWKVPCNRPLYCEEVVHRVYPRVFAGDSLWVKETWKPGLHDALGCLRFDYRADCHPAMDKGMKWKSPLHMPRRASRLVLPVVRVGAERLQDIDNNDASAEGTPDLRTLENDWDLRDCFKALWQSINGKRPGLSWESNPPLWVYEWEKR